MFFYLRTCFYVLGLMSSTSIGADRLEDLGWESVRHKGADKWPVIEQDITYIWEPDISDEELVQYFGQATTIKSQQYVL